MFETCGQCGARVSAKMAVTVAHVPNTYGYMAVLWRCAVCGFEGRTALPVGHWENAKGYAEATERKIDVVVSEFGKDLDVLIGDVGDLLNVWESLRTPPPLELEPGKGCKCSHCLKRRYGGVDDLARFNGS